MLKNQVYIEDWAPLRVGEDQLLAHVYEHKDGRRRVYFQDSRASEDDIGTGEGVNVTRISYRAFGDKVLFSGMMVARNRRGGGLGEKLISYFIEEVRNNGDTFVGTGVIRKPLIALSLGRAGLMPASQDFMAEILPWSSLNRSSVPKIYVVKNCLEGQELIEGSEHGPFYEVVPEAEVTRSFPLNAPNMTVALHTPYGLNAPTEATN